MWAILGGMLTGLVGSALARVLVGGGLALVTFAALNALVATALDVIAIQMAGLPAGLAAIISRSGLGVAMSLWGGAAITVVGIQAAMVGIKKA